MTNLPVLDARARGAFEAGHAPGAASLPAPEWSDRSAELPPRTLDFAVVGDDAAHSGALAEALRARGYAGARAAGVAELGDRREIGVPRAFLWRPSDWLVAATPLLPSAGRALDVATGSGRHAVWLALHGLATWGLDVLPDALERAQRLERATRAMRSFAACGFVRADATREFPFQDETFDVVCGFRYLERNRFHALARLLRPGGTLLWETFTIEQARFGRPRRREFLLEPDELERLCAAAGLEILAAGESVAPRGPALAAVRARRPCNRIAP